MKISKVLTYTYVYYINETTVYTGWAKHSESNAFQT